jgi:ATP-dependent Clp protease ATP-binding subunit ClpX
MKHDTGARSLRSVLENTMNDLLFEVPSMDNIAEAVVTRETVEKQTMPKLIMQEPSKRKKAS